MEDVVSLRLVRRHLYATLTITCVTAWFSYAYFHNDEHFQIIEYVRAKRGEIDPRFLPWEHAQRMRPWLQPALYWGVSRVLAVIGVTDIFQLAFAFRFVTGLANVGALALFLRTTLPWMETPEEKLVHLRVATLTGFLPYLFVRTSSESASMAFATAGFALLLQGASPSSSATATWTVVTTPRRTFLSGLCLGLAFEMRFQSAFLILGVGLWLLVIARPGAMTFAQLVAGAVVALGLGGLADRWGYGEWAFPPWRYAKVNLFEGVAARYGTDPPLAYFWLLPGNVFFLVVLTMLGLAVLAWIRFPRHPITWATLPFFVVHNLLSHKEERFLFPIAIFATALVSMAIGPPSRLWRLRDRWPAKVLVASSFAGMALLAFYPLGWNQNARFMRFVHDTAGNDFVAYAFPDVDLTLPAFHPRTYDVIHTTPQELATQIERGAPRAWLISDSPELHTGTLVDAHASLVFTELPGFEHPWLASRVMAATDTFNAKAPARLRRIRYRSLYRIAP